MGSAVCCLWTHYAKFTLDLPRCVKLARHGIKKPSCEAQNLDDGRMMSKRTDDDDHDDDDDDDDDYDDYGDDDYDDGDARSWC